MMLGSSDSPSEENGVVGGVFDLDRVAIVINREKRDGKVKGKHFRKVV